MAAAFDRFGVVIVTVSTLVWNDTAARPLGLSFPDSLAQQLLEYSKAVTEADSPAEVLDRLHAITSRSLDLNVFGACRFPQRVMDWGALKVGEPIVSGKFCYAAISFEDRN